MFQTNKHLLLSLMSVFIQKNIIARNQSFWKMLQIANEQALFQAFLLKSNRLMNIYIQKTKIRYQCQLILKIIEYSNPVKFTRSSSYNISEKFGCLSQVSLPKFEEHLFLITAFKVYHRCKEHGEGPSKFDGGGGIFSQCTI